MRAHAHDEQQCGHGHGARHGAGGEAQHDQNTTCQIHASEDGVRGLPREGSIAPRGG